MIAAAAPAFWLAYNGIVYRNPLEFENGPYSAKAIERKTQSAGNLGHPGSGNLVVAGMYFLKSAENNAGRQRIPAEELDSPSDCSRSRSCANFPPQRRNLRLNVPIVHLAPARFLLIPIPFYALSVAYSGVPIFVPRWWPFSHYNVRYGLQLLPAFAVALAILVYLADAPSGTAGCVSSAC